MASPSTRAAASIDRDLVRRRIQLNGVQKVWLLTAAIAIIALALSDQYVGNEGLEAPLRIPLAGLIAAFYLAELAVVHLEFGRQAHSFSMSEFALVLGLFFASPTEVILANLAANALVLTIHRRQPVLKLMFNLAQFALQASVAVGVFHMYSQLGDPLGPVGWAGALLATLAALLLADILINAAIRFTGGRIGFAEMVEVFGMGALAASLNTAMALGAAMILWHRPSAVWLAAAPPLALFGAYWAFVFQRVQRSRLKALYDATRDLHGAPQLEKALTRACASVRKLLNAESAEIYLVSEVQDGRGIATSVGPDGPSRVMKPVAMSALALPWLQAIRSGATVNVGAKEAEDQVASLAVPLAGSGGDGFGVVVARNRLGDIGGFRPSEIETLETFAAQIAVSVANARLVDSLSAAAELNREQETLIRAKDEFIASVSHELRTPLTTVVGLSQVLQSEETLPDVERAELTALIAEQSGELSDLVEDLLVSARADIGTLDISLQGVAVANEVESVLRGVAGGDRVIVRGEPATAWADALRLRQVVRNLVSNAHRYGGDEVRVELGREDSHVIVAVVDDGPGVPPGHEESIFEAYGRAHQMGGQPASIGLGLHVAQRLVRQMGGDLVYRRHQGETRFEVTLRAVA